LKTVSQSAGCEPLANDAGSETARAALDRNCRIIFDVSSIVRWVGPAVGIVRVEHALAAYARAGRRNIVLSIYDPASASFFEVAAPWAESILGWDGALDMVTFDYRRYWPRLRAWRSPRYPLIMALERRRLSARSPRIRRAIDAAQKGLWPARRLPLPFADRQGRRFEIVPLDLALGRKVSLGPRDIVATAGYDWFNQDPVKIAEQKRRHGFRYVVMCYDIIPLQFPEFFAEHDVAQFRRYWEATFFLADRILVNSRRVGRNIQDYCAAAGHIPPETRVVALGFDPPGQRPGVLLPDGLEPSRFILFVSTIEPRKGHAMLAKVWRRLLAAGVPQKHRFKLVFVGRRGWKMEGLQRQIDDPAAFGGSLVHLEGIGDDELAALYAAAAFCVYPSVYEGFGLPIVEAFSHGKAVIASTGGGLPETVGKLSPCLDPGDEEAWLTALERWIEDPEARAPYEASIRDSISWPTWDAAAAQFFEAASDLGALPAPAIAP
jgi:glycosyltransferase involved in cell wall biosynthesis